MNGKTETPGKKLSFIFLPFGVYDEYIVICKSCLCLYPNLLQLGCDTTTLYCCYTGYDYVNLNGLVGLVVWDGMGWCGTNERTVLQIELVVRPTYLVALDLVGFMFVCVCVFCRNNNKQCFPFPLNV